MSCKNSYLAMIIKINNKKKNNPKIIMSMRKKKKNFK